MGLPGLGWADGSCPGSFPPIRAGAWAFLASGGSGSLDLAPRSITGSWLRPGPVCTTGAVWRCFVTLSFAAVVVAGGVLFALFLLTMPTNFMGRLGGRSSSVCSSTPRCSSSCSSGKRLIEELFDAAVPLLVLVAFWLLQRGAQVKVGYDDPGPHRFGARQLYDRDFHDHH